MGWRQSGGSVSGWCIFLPVVLWAMASSVKAASAQTECKGPPELEAKVQTQADADAYTQLGTWFGEHQQFQCSSQAFQSALKLDPNSAKLSYFLGLALYSAGQVAASLDVLQQSAKLDDKAIQPRLLLGTIYQQLNRKEDAEAQWRAALQIDPASVPALHGLANALIDSGDIMVAVDMLKPAVSSGGDEDLTLDLARAYGKAGMLDDAAATMQRALSADPASFRLTNAMTTVLVQQHRYQDAVKLMQGYVQLHPDEVEAQNAYFSALVLNHDTETARPLGQKLLALEPHDANLLYLNGILEREAGEYAAARDHLEEALKTKPEDYSIHYNLGAALAHLNDPAGARQQLEKAIALDPTQPQAHFQLATLLRSLGQTDAAQEQMKIVKQLSNASTARSQAQSKSKLASDKLAEGDVAQAIALYREAVAATPDDALLQYKFSVALDRASNIADERAALEKAVKLDPTFALAQDQLGYLETRSGELAQAEQHFRLAVKSAPAFIDAWINLAATLAGESHMPEAKQAIANALKIDPTNAEAMQLNQKLNEATYR